MGHILKHAAEYETVRRLAEMLETAKEDYKATESYALFTTIVCWVMQRARTQNNANNPADIQAREVGKALQSSSISEAPWSVPQVSAMSTYEFFVCIRNAVAHGDGRKIRPLNENGILVGQVIPVDGLNLELRRADMRRLGCALADLFCSTMAEYEQEGNLREAAETFDSVEEAA